jgi:cytosine/adenosine deaminase-related metal-dependent hydrolase
MILQNVTAVGNDQKISIRIKFQQIAEISTAVDPGLDEKQLIFEDAIIFPGLINSHDHLDFNLFEQFGSQTYPNYTVWAKTLHQDYAKEIKKILSIPKTLREQWGLYKNLICGVTTVVNHGPKIGPCKKPINIIEECQSLHSVQFEKHWKLRLNNPFKRNKNVAIHIGEGTDRLAKEEIDSLIKWNLINRKIIGIHGVALYPQQSSTLEALVWCPESNYFLLAATANLKAIKLQIPILFGTDSTLTSNWNIWHHIKFARSLKILTDEEILHSLNINPAKTWELLTGRINIGYQADLVVAKQKDKENSIEAFYKVDASDLLLVLVKGEVMLFDSTIATQFNSTERSGYQKIKVGGQFKYIIGNIGLLMAEIRHYHPKVEFPIEILNTN